MPHTQPAPASPPQTSPEDRPGTAPRLGRLLTLLTWLITYGEELATTLRHGTNPRRFATLAYSFQTTDLAAILARIRRGLMLAAALHAKLTQHQAAGHDIKPSPLRLPSQRHPRDHTTAEPKPRVRHTNIIDLPLDRLPSAEAIAAELRRRPIGAILVDICRDLCVRPGDLTGERWSELAQAIMAYDGNMAALLFDNPVDKKVKERTRRFLAGEPLDESLAWVIPALPPPAAAASPTGPPDDAREPIAA